jgi:hypothetical protein
VGIDAAARFHEAWLASGPGGPHEMTLEQWLRRERGNTGLPGDAELPVCDGCACGACATLARPDGAPAPCGDDALWVEPNGRPYAPEEPPRIEDARVTAVSRGKLRIEVKLRTPAHTLTQPPIFEGDSGYPEGATFESFVPYPNTRPRAFADLPGAYRLGVEPMSAEPTTEPSQPARWPWRVSLAKGALAKTYNRANLLLPAARPVGVRALRIALLRGGDAAGAREIPLPEDL